MNDACHRKFGLRESDDRLDEGLLRQVIAPSIDPSSPGILPRRRCAHCESMLGETASCWMCSAYRTRPEAFGNDFCRCG